MGLAEAGADVAVASRKLDACEEVAGEIERLGRRAEAIQLDLQDPEQIDATADRALASLGRLDILVNNAAVTWGAPILDYPMVGWDKVFNVNVRGLWQLSQRVARHMSERGSGSVVHVASISGLRGAWEHNEPAIAYNASKGAVITLTKDMAVKLASHGIRVNAISPGAFDTSLMDNVRGSEEQLEAFLSQIPMHRAGMEDDVKGVAVFLASEASAYVTGHNLVVDGGWFVTG
jgi:gluconate 5-dehydrogenase